MGLGEPTEGTSGGIKGRKAGDGEHKWGGQSEEERGKMSENTNAKGDISGGERGLVSRRNECRRAVMAANRGGRDRS